MTKQVWAVIMAVWFLIVSGFVLIPTYRLLSAPAAVVPVAPAPPEPPQFAAEESKELRDSRIALFTQRGAMYGQQVTAYSKYVDAQAGPGHAAYDLAILRTIQPLLDKFLVAVLAYVFAKASAQLIDNALRLRHGKDPLEIKFWD